MPCVRPGLVSPHGYHAAIGEEGAAAGESRYALQDFEQRDPAKSAQLVLGHHRHHARRVGELFRELRRRRDLGVRQRVEIH